jgi:hypothetical protein
LIKAVFSQLFAVLIEEAIDQGRGRLPNDAKVLGEQGVPCQNSLHGADLRLR